MTEMTEFIQSQVKEVMVPKYFYEKIDGKQLGDFFKRNGIVSPNSGDKNTKIYRLFSLIQQEDKFVPEFEPELISFFLKTIKYTNNRIMIEVPLKISMRASIIKKVNLFNFMGINEESFEINHILNLIVSPDDNIITNNHDGKFNLIYRKASTEDEDIKTIELAFVRSVEYAIKEGITVRTENKYEYVWCEIDVVNETLRLFISNNRKTTNDDQLDGSIHQMQKYFCDKLSKEFDFRVTSIYDGRTLFKIYRELTSKSEGKYSDVVSAYKNDIERFVSEMKTKLNISDNDDIDLDNRILKLFERNLIQKDFEKIAKDPLVDGRVISLDFRDDTGSSVKATTGGSKLTEDGLISLDMQDSDVYFDTRETIHSLKTLGVLIVEWNAIRDLPDLEERYQKPKAVYIAYKDYYVCRINRINLDEEVSNYVLSKFNYYRGLPI